MKIHNIIVHHTGGTDANPLVDSSNYTIHNCNSDHKIRFNMISSLGYYVGYHYFIDKDGVLTQTRMDLEEGAHCKGYNNSAYDKLYHPEALSIGVCLAGNFDATLPNEKQITTLRKLLQEKVTQYGIQPKNIVPHRAHAHKTCYGNLLSESWARNLISAQAVEDKLFNVNLSRYDVSEDVRNLQVFLNSTGFKVSWFGAGSKGKETTFFGDKTQKALIKFQKQNGIQTHLGEFDDVTRDIVNRMV